MNVKGKITSPALKTFLEFESLKQNLPIYYEEVHLRYYSLSAFKRQIKVIVNSESGIEKDFNFQIKERFCVFQSKYCFFPCSETFKVLNGQDEEIPLAGIEREHLFIFFDLKPFFEGKVEIKDEKGELLPINSLNPLNCFLDYLFLWAMPKIKENIENYNFENEKKEYLSLRLKSEEMKIRKWQEDMKENEEEVQSKQAEINALLEKIVEQKTFIEAKEKKTKVLKRKQAEKEFKELFKLVPQALFEISFTHDSLQAMTYPVSITYNHHEYQVGDYKIIINLIDHKITIENQKEDKIIEGFHHPHINQSGIPCFGNLETSIKKLLLENEYAIVLSTTLNFLKSYNSDNPYRKIMLWDPNYEENEKYEECYENASTSDCVDCTDSDCPYYSSRYERCYENTEPKICIRCQECDYYHQAIKDCQNAREVWECVQCEIKTCEYAGKIEQCYQIHKGKECPSCPVDCCQYNPKKAEI